jgi:hypothetical protein
MFNANVVDNFLTNQECQKILDFAQRIEDWGQDDSEFWNNRYLNASNVTKLNPEIGKMLYDIRSRIAKQIEMHYGINKIYSDLFQIVRWFPGMEQQPHADDMTNAHGDGLEWFAHREFGSIVYLNEDYSGGKTYYPNYNFEVEPKSGKLAIHPGDPDHLHGVTRIEGNVRYTLASFWTQDKSYLDNWAI